MLIGFKSKKLKCLTTGSLFGRVGKRTSKEKEKGGSRRVFRLSKRRFGPFGKGFSLHRQEKPCNMIDLIFSPAQKISIKSVGMIYWD